MWSTPVPRISRAVFVFPLLHPKMSLWICTSKPLWVTETGEFCDLSWSPELWGQETAIMWFHALSHGKSTINSWVLHFSVLLKGRLS